MTREWGWRRTTDKRRCSRGKRQRFIYSESEEKEGIIDESAAFNFSKTNQTGSEITLYSQWRWSQAKQEKEAHLTAYIGSGLLLVFPSSFMLLLFHFFLHSSNFRGWLLETFSVWRISEYFCWYMKKVQIPLLTLWCDQSSTLYALKSLCSLLHCWLHSYLALVSSSSTCCLISAVRCVK